MNTCKFVWIGDGWSKVNDNCDSGKTCSEPPSRGSFIGQEETVTCA